MSLNWIRTFCLALPRVTEDVKWEKDLVFSIGAMRAKLPKGVLAGLDG